MRFTILGAEAYNAVANGDVAHIAHRNDEEFVGTMRNQKTLAIADVLTLYRGQQLGDGAGGGNRLYIRQSCVQFLTVDGFQQIVDAVELEGLHSVVVVGGCENDGDGCWYCLKRLET